MGQGWCLQISTLRFFNSLYLFFHIDKTKEKHKEIVVLQKLNLAC